MWKCKRYKGMKNNYYSSRSSNNSLLIRSCAVAEAAVALCVCLKCIEFIENAAFIQLSYIRTRTNNALILAQYNEISLCAQRESSRADRIEVINLSACIAFSNVVVCTAAAASMLIPTKNTMNAQIHSRKATLLCFYSSKTPNVAKKENRIVQL